jgi:cobalt-zinc-cadmium efflux system membrane fusion protein
MKRYGGRFIAGGCLLAAMVLAISCQQRGATPPGGAAHPAAPSSQTVTINAEQARQVHVASTSERDFAPYIQAVGYVDFDQDHLAQVTSPYAGRVREVFAKAGEAVTRGQPLFSVDSPDLAQAEATLVSAAASWTQTKAALTRAKGMAQVQANAPRDLEQAVADQQTAEGNYQAARRALLIFGKNATEIDRIAAARRADGELRITSPTTGLVAARNIAAGDLVQPGNSPAPFNIADSSSLWLVANVAEADSPLLHLGLPLSANLQALPGQRIASQIDYVGSSSDPNTHRVVVRATLHAPPAGLRPQMLVDYAIRTAEPAPHIAVPENAVVREGDGHMVVFTTQDGLSFTRHQVTLGQPQDGYYPVLSGLSTHQQIAADGALFLSNALALQSQ